MKKWIPLAAVAALGIWMLTRNKAAVADDGIIVRVVDGPAEVQEQLPQGGFVDVNDRAWGIPNIADGTLMYQEGAAWGYGASAGSARFWRPRPADWTGFTDPGRQPVSTIMPVVGTGISAEVRRAISTSFG